MTLVTRVLKSEFSLIYEVSQLLKMYSVQSVDPGRRTVQWYDDPAHSCMSDKNTAEVQQLLAAVYRL